MPMSPRLLPLRFLLALLAFMLVGCDTPDSLQEIKKKGVLRVITRNGPTTYYVDRHGPNGFEYVLAKRFAQHLGVELEVETEVSLQTMFEELRKGRADLAAAGLAITPAREAFLDFAPPYLDVEHQVIVRKADPTPLREAELIGLQIKVMADSGPSEALLRAKTDVPALNWTEEEDVETIDLLDALDSGEIDATVIDSNEFIANRAFYTNLRPAFRLGRPTQHAWAVRPGPQTAALHQELERFFAALRETGELEQLVERFYSHSEYNDQINSLAFAGRVAKRLPRYVDMIQQVANEYGMDWRLLAAVSYQESHWEPKATSPTGVVGFMMLTRPTAKAVGVTNRRDALQSLRGGAEYLQRMHQRLPSRITEPDRTWFALAAYNVGLGHLEDARIITAKQGRNPDKWVDVKEHLPLLRKHQWYRNTKYGYARGSEPVHYVQNIRHYYNVLTWTDLAKKRIPPPRITDQYLPDGFDITLNAL